MALFQIPLNNDFNDFSQVHGLDNKKYTFKFRYNKRNDTWYLQLLNDLNEVLIGAKPCLSNVIQYTGRLNRNALPIGDIIFVDVSVTGLDCTQENFGDAIKLYYQNVDPA